jgi:N-glycosylase/DNA lyase
MRYEEKNGNTYISDLRDFSLAQTMECGQCFHFVKLAEDEYGLVAGHKFLHARQDGDVLCLFDTGLKDAQGFWTDYFDLNRDYGAIKSELLGGDGKLTEAVETMWGVRILNQEFFETLISFIISQNKQIPHIKQIVATLSRLYGEKLAEIEMPPSMCTDNGKKGNSASDGVLEFYAFPTVEQMKNVTVEDLQACKTGFRAPYIYDAVSRVAAGEFDANALKAMSVDDCNESLIHIKGVGAKVANCVSLFGLGHREAFPVDVWIKRIVEQLYFDGQEMSVEKIGQFGCSRFGEYGGYAQQYLFYYGKTIKAGKKS